MLSSATTLWYLFERAGYNFLSFVANVILLLVVILFLWAKAANLLNRCFTSSGSFCIFNEILVANFDCLNLLDFEFKRNLVLRGKFSA